jgi:hypothetical protein
MKESPEHAEVDIVVHVSDADSPTASGPAKGNIALARHKMDGDVWLGVFTRRCRYMVAQ